ncbi:MAG: general secretion pathway protein GspK [Planctomycetes bacterium]|nr:general secretion pathway protein GspK [Planctomycetota bacterium]
MLLLRTRTAVPPRRGVVLIAVLIVVVLLTLAAYQYSELMMAEYRASVSFTRATQVRSFAESGVNYAALLLSDPNQFANRLSGNPYDNPEVFRAVAVGEAGGGGRQGYFSVIAPYGPDETPSGSTSFHYGAVDESGKINLNNLLKADSSGTLAVQILTNLNIPEDTANAILDWMDADDTPRPNGAESETYSTMNPPYQARNGPFQTLEELLFVRGVTPDLLFGTDLDRTGGLNSAAGAQRDLGWSAYLTVYSREQNIDSDGNPRTYINDANTTNLYPTLSDLLGADVANYIMIYRRYGPNTTTAPSGQTAQGMGTTQPPSTGSSTSRPPTATPPAASGGTTQQTVTKRAGDLTQDALGLSSNATGRRIASLFDLVNSEVLIPASGQQQPATRVPSPLNDPQKLKDTLPLLLDKLTTTRNQDLPARVNVNTAARAVLLALPGLTESDVDTILSTRPSPGTNTGTDTTFNTPAWLLTQANLDVNKLKTLEKFITARSQVYRVQVVGHFKDGGPTARIEAVIDTNRGRPRIVYWRDLSELGRGFTLPAVE